MNTTARIIGNHGFFIREGDAFTSPAPGTVGRNSKPDGAETTWIDLGILTEVSIEPTMEERPIFAPAPGRLRKYDVLETKDELTITLRAEELSPLAMQALLRTAKLGSSSTQYNPLEGGQIKGWLQVKQYDQDDALFNTVEVYCRLKVGAITFGDDIARAEFTGDVLHSTLNTGALA